MKDIGEVGTQEAEDLTVQAREALSSNEQAVRFVRIVCASTLFLTLTAFAAAFWFEAPTLALTGAVLCAAFFWSIRETTSLMRDNLTLELLPAMARTAPPEEVTEEVLLRLRQAGCAGSTIRPVEYVLLHTLAAVLQPPLGRSPSGWGDEKSPTLGLLFSTLPRHHVRYLQRYLRASGTRRWVVVPSRRPQRLKFSPDWLLPWWRELIWALSFFLIAASLHSNTLLASVFLFAAPMPSFTLIVAKARTKREIGEACHKLLRA